MWANPSLPVGGSDTGIGLEAGEVMFSLITHINTLIGGMMLFQVQLILEGNPENFDHNGLFNNHILNLGLTIGLNDYWNITFLPIFLENVCMEWSC